MTHVELAIDDLPAAARFFRQVLALPVRRLSLERAEVRLTPDITAHLVPAASRSRPVIRQGPGPILQLEVPEVRAAVTELRRRGATVLVDRVLTDWGTESAFVAGPGDLVIEVYRPYAG
jgi:catechol 2,3-dioxygenase-like lactoylglutathione lyase family enzyme